MQVQLRAGLPKGEANGLMGRAADFVTDEEPRLVLALVSQSRLVTDTDSGDQSVQLKVRRVELILDGDDITQLQRIMVRAHERRSGQPVLPFDTEQAIEKVFQQYAAGDLDGPAPDDRPGSPTGDE
jgi:hypothetical protein